MIFGVVITVLAVNYRSQMQRRTKVSSSFVHSISRSARDIAETPS
jgi:hypothetical protein